MVSWAGRARGGGKAVRAEEWRVRVLPGGVPEGSFRGIPQGTLELRCLH